jgi:cobyrinic acid a,c-diamide synthase
MKNSSFLPASQGITGHEFHYSCMHPDRDARFAIRLSRGKGIDSGKDGLTGGNVLGTYTHAYLTEAFSDIFVEEACRFSNDWQDA